MPVKEYSETFINWMMGTVINHKLTWSNYESFTVDLKIIDPLGNEVASGRGYQLVPYDLITFSGDEKLTFNFSEGTYSVVYESYCHPSTDYYRATVESGIAFVANRYPTKPWTITDVISRTFELIEPLKFGEKPRFRLQGVNYDNLSGNALSDYEQGSQAEKYNKILAPEFSFTKMTLREQLNQIGGFIIFKLC